MTTADALAARISTLGEPSEVAGLMGAVLGLIPDRDALARDLVGFYVSTAEDGSFTAWLASAAGLTRYETANGVSMTVTLPASRVTRLVERLSAAGLEVMLEMDADDVLLRAADASGTLTRASRSSYTLVESITSAHIGELHAFASAIRASMHR